MNELFDKQYNKSAITFNDLYLDQQAHVSTEDFFDVFKKYVPKKSGSKLLDLGCGAGADFTFYNKEGFECAGIDASLQMCNLAIKNKVPADVRNESFSEKISFEEKSFDVVVSKYAIQTAWDIEPIYQEAARVLKPGGFFAFLVVHPFRQFLEKKKKGKNYFEKESVESIIFDGKITVQEPTHTMEEYLSDQFFKNFSLLKIKEGYDFPASEQIGGDTYPTYMIVIARKK